MNFTTCRARKKRGFNKAAKPVTLTSTVGAGDSFIAAWISAYLTGRTPEWAAKAAADLYKSYPVSHTPFIAEFKRMCDVPPSLYWTEKKMA